MSLMPIIDEYKDRPSLTIEDAGHGNKYYGVVCWSVKQQDKPQAVQEIEAFLKQYIPNFTRFCNFKTRKNGEKTIRYLCKYSQTFEGVAYIELRELKSLIIKKKYGVAQTIPYKTYARFLRRYQYPVLDSIPILGNDVSGMQYVDKDKTIIISLLYEKINGQVVKSYYYNRRK